MRPTLTLVLFTLLLVLPGCNTAQIEEATHAVEEISAGMQDIQIAVAEASEQKLAIDAALESMPPGEGRDKAIALSAKLEEAIAVGSMWLARADESISVLQIELANAEEPLDVAEGVIRAAQPFIPAPWGAIALGASGLIIGFLRARNTRIAARNIVESVEPTIKRTSADTKDRIAAAQSPAAARLVDEAQGKKLALPF